MHQVRGREIEYRISIGSILYVQLKLVCQESDMYILHLNSISFNQIHFYGTNTKQNRPLIEGWGYHKIQ